MDTNSEAPASLNRKGLNMAATSALVAGTSYAWVGADGALDAGSFGGSVHDGVACLYDGVRYHYVPVGELRLAEHVTVEEWLGVA
ncbi:hypothetical protein SEA_OSCAR_94 [Mycobacterium phage Oscar]|nr:hypothetical protein SEA_OSCAR_94 [Mycobacterium phage Oscar]